MAKRKKKTKARAQSRPRARKLAASEAEQGMLNESAMPGEAQGAGTPRILYFDGKDLNPRPHMYAGGKWHLTDWKWHVERDLKEAQAIVAGENAIPDSKWANDARVRSARKALEKFTAAARFIDAGDADAAAIQAYCAAAEVWRCRMMLDEGDAMITRHRREMGQMKALKKARYLQERNEKITEVSRTLDLSAEQTRRRFKADRSLFEAYPEVSELCRETISRIISAGRKSKKRVFRL